MRRFKGTKCPHFVNLHTREERRVSARTPPPRRAACTRPSVYRFDVSSSVCFDALIPGIAPESIVRRHRRENAVNDNGRNVQVHPLVQADPGRMLAQYRAALSLQSEQVWNVGNDLSSLGSISQVVCMPYPLDYGPRDLERTKHCEGRSNH